MNVKIARRIRYLAVGLCFCVPALLRAQTETPGRQVVKVPMRDGVKLATKGSLAGAADAHAL
jgi:hypothetical protein